MRSHNRRAARSLRTAYRLPARRMRAAARRAVRRQRCRRAPAAHCAPIPSLWLTRADPRLARRRLYRGLTSLWGRQIPYTMMKFGAFERTVQLLYANVVPKPREECTKSEQLGVSFAAGYIAGIFCAVVSHPADNLVSKLNANKAATVSSVVSEMGMVALLTRGLPLRIIMVGTLTGLQWGIYDAFKVAVGLPTTGCVPSLAAHASHALLLPSCLLTRSALRSAKTKK